MTKLASTPYIILNGSNWNGFLKLLVSESVTESMYIEGLSVIERYFSGDSEEGERQPLPSFQPIASKLLMLDLTVVPNFNVTGIAATDFSDIVSSVLSTTEKPYTEEDKINLRWLSEQNTEVGNVFISTAVQWFLRVTSGSEYVVKSAMNCDNSKALLSKILYAFRHNGVNPCNPMTLCHLDRTAIPSAQLGHEND